MCSGHNKYSLSQQGVFCTDRNINTQERQFHVYHIDKIEGIAQLIEAGLETLNQCDEFQKILIERVQKMANLESWSLTV